MHSDCSWGSLLRWCLELTWLLESQVVKVKCSKLFSTDPGFIGLRFKESPHKIPLNATELATVLFSFGAYIIIIGSLLQANKVVGFCEWWKLLSPPLYFTTWVSLTMHSKAAGVTPDIPDFDDLHPPQPQEKSRRCASSDLRSEHKQWLLAKEFCILQVFNK